MIKRFLGSQLRRNMASGMLAMIASVIVLLISYPLYLHFLGWEKYGVWLALTTVVSVMRTGGNLGIAPALIKLVAEEHGRKDPRGCESYVVMGLTVLGLSGAVALIVILCLRSQIVSLFNLTGENAAIALNLLPYVGLWCAYVFFLRVLGAVLSGLGRMDLTNYIQLAGLVITLSVAALLLYSGLGIKSLLIGNIVSCVVVHVVSIVCIRLISDVHIFRVSSWDWQRFKRLFQFGGTVFASSFVTMLISPFNKIMLARYVGVSSLPVYELAFRGASTFRNVFESVLRPMMPEISRLAGQATIAARERIKMIHAKVTKLIGLVALPLYITLALLAEPLLRLWLRGKYLDEIPNCFRIMLLGTFLSLLGVPAFHTLMGLGKAGYCLMTNVIIAGGNVTGGLIFMFALGGISINKIGFSLAAGFGVSSAYVIYKYYKVASSALASTAHEQI